MIFFMAELTRLLFCCCSKSYHGISISICRNRKRFQKLFVVFLNTINIPCTRLYIVATTTKTAGNFAAVVVVVQVRFQKKTQPEIQDVQEEVLSTFFRKCTRLWQVRTFHFLSQHVRFELLNLHMVAAPQPSDREGVYRR